MSFADWRRGAVGWLERTGKTARGWLSSAVRLLDQGLRGLDGLAVAGRDRLLRAANLRAEDLDAPSLVARAPEWLRRPVQAVGRWLGAAGAWLGRVFAFVPRDPQWTLAATGLLLLLGVTIIGSFITPPEFMPRPGVWRPIIVGYYENGWSEMYPDSLPTLQRHTESIDIVMPFWYSIHPDGSIENRGSKPEVVSLAHANGIQVVPLMNNAKTGTSAGFLTDAAARQEAAAEIKALVEENGYDGVHIDFELLPARWKDQLTSFIAEIRAVLGPSKHLSMAVFPQVDVDYELSGVYDYAALSGLCDFIVIMGYDRHYAGGPPGPVSPYDWIESNIKHALDLGISPSKIVMAVGGYGYDWPTGGMASDIPSLWVPDLVRRTGARPQWDTASQNPYFTYYAGRNRHEVWYQDERVMAQRIEQARHYGLKGLALWRLGYETPRTWTVIRGEVGPRRTGGR